MKISYRVKNLRKLKETPFIEIRPLTILVGKNSAGKSTYLRSFPLLRQSIETKASAPILWWGDYVDFGDFKSSVYDQNVQNLISFDFEIENIQNSVKNSFSFINNFEADSSKELFKKVKVEYVIKLDGASTVSEKINISLEDPNIEMTLRFESGFPFAESICIGEIDICALIEELRVYFPENNIFQNPLIFRKVPKTEELKIERIKKLFIEYIEKEITGKVGRNVSKKTIIQESNKILNMPDISKISIDVLKNTRTNTFKKFYKSLSDINVKLASKLDAICKANRLMDALSTANSELKKYFRSIEYIGPARVRSERFYRQQELQVLDISPDGQNLPVFLASLSVADLNRFSLWVEKRFGYGIEINKTDSHISIILKQSGIRINILDTGYGVSQVLPVLAQLWWMKNRPEYYRRIDYIVSNPVLVIEQPELHLHPAHQALLADVFSDCLVKESEDSLAISLIVETHSEALINKLGELVSKGKVRSEDIQIIIFGEDLRNESEVTLATFDNEGVLSNWPYGFFNFA